MKKGKQSCNYLTKREFFLAKAMQGLCANHSFIDAISFKSTIAATPLAISALAIADCTLALLENEESCTDQPLDGMDTTTIE